MKDIDFSDGITYDFNEQEKELARVLYASERYGNYRQKVSKLPPIYALLVKSLRKIDNLNAVNKALQALVNLKENA